MEYFLTKKGVIALEFSYRESCNNVYKYFSVWLNGEKKNIRTARKLLNGFEENELCILTANTYKWHPGASSKSRRDNEDRRYREWDSFVGVLEELNKKISIPFKLYSNNKYSVMVNESEIIIKNLRLRQDIYHYQIFSDAFSPDYDFEALIKDAKAKRIEQINKYRLDNKLELNINDIAKKVYINEDDSIKAGNCPTETFAFAKTIRNKIKVPIKAIRGDFLLKIRNDNYTKRVIIYKAKQLNLI